MKTLIVLVLGAGMLAGCTGMLLGGSSGGNYPASGTSSPAASADDAQISAAVRSRLARSASLAGSNIQVETHAGRVTLRGTVASYAERQRAGGLARQVASVVTVDNQIRVMR